MAVLTIEVLKKIIENVPDDYEISCRFNDNVFKLSDKIEVDISDKAFILKKY